MLKQCCKTCVYYASPVDEPGKRISKYDCKFPLPPVVLPDSVLVGGYPALKETNKYRMGPNDGSTCSAYSVTLPSSSNPWYDVASVERQIRTAAFASAGDPQRMDDMKMFAIWAGVLQKAMKYAGFSDTKSGKA